MNNYVLFCYDGSNWHEYKSSNSLKALKKMVEEQRNEHYPGRGVRHELRQQARQEEQNSRCAGHGC
jgi:hypothetical protein